MAVTTTFYNWQRSDLDWDAHPYEAPSPNLVALLAYLTARWGGVSLGIHGDRPIRKGSSPSSHAYGAALDWRWGFHPNWAAADWISRETLEREVLPFLIDNSAELGIQAIHDQGRIWRSDRPGTEWDRRWKAYNTGYGEWLHIETTLQSWGRRDPIADRLGVPTTPPAPAPDAFDPAVGLWGLWPLNADKQRLAVPSWISANQPGNNVWTSHGDVVRYLQGVIALKGGGDIAIDGRYGPKSEGRVRDLQKWFGLKVDGLVGPATWAKIDSLSGA